MSAAAQADPAFPAPDPAVTADAHLRDTITALIDAGARLVQDLVAEDAPASAKAEPYERLARAVRRSVLLARHAAENPVRTQAARRTQARKQIIRAVEDTIEREARTAPRAGTLRDELRERLDAPDLDDDIANRPIEEIIRDIRRDLGLDNIPGARPRPRRNPAALQALTALAAAPPGAAAALPQSPPASSPSRPGTDDELHEDDDPAARRLRPPSRFAVPLSSPSLLATLLARPPPNADR